MKVDPLFHAGLLTCAEADQSLTQKSEHAMPTAKQLWIGIGMLLGLLIATTLIVASRLAALQGDLDRIAANKESASDAASEMKVHVNALGLPILILLVGGVIVGTVIARLAIRAVLKSEARLQTALIHAESVVANERAGRNERERLNLMEYEFLATVSHELRSPLQAILGWSQLLQSGQLIGDAVTKAADAIVTSARTQSQLIEDLLDVSRIVSGKIVLDMRPIRIDKVIQQAIQTVQPAATAKELTLQQSLDPKCGPVLGDANRLQQAVWNLLSNAIKFTPRGGQVQITLSHVDSLIQISVSDTGQGMKPDFLPHVFARFRQADASTARLHGGLGLGLTIVRHLVELHGGQVQADSPGEKQGATFTVSLPLAAVCSGEPTDLRELHDK